MRGHSTIALPIRPLPQATVNDKAHVPWLGEWGPLDAAALGRRGLADPFCLVLAWTDVRERR